ncbi:uncharacterized protein LY89DRAFT_649396 [Mollisia scopiformis]|uniref:Rhodopsin domain-containing protein n=1 Tax=Mollisia scopiformis TaxID=149040 RepID=A0A194X3Q6_MOLSC|nr:uncharacterized protein LY89DRAFT_649396 [Mollisia scopiformis]KUJ14828.1 hypothetical protein LY89DRAFT_649396 [Mollisia scopiformis]
MGDSTFQGETPLEEAYMLDGSIILSESTNRHHSRPFKNGYIRYHFPRIQARPTVLGGMGFDGLSRGDSVIACSVATVVLASIIVMLRLFTRSKILGFVGPEDWCILVALLFSIANTVGMCVQVENALGRHMASLTSDQIMNFLKAYYVTVVFYNISQTLAKVSILLLYLRIFSVTNIRTPCYFMLGFVTLYGIELFFSAVLMCVPAAHWWDSSHVPGTCLAEKPLWFTNVSINILTDIGIVILPMPVISTLVLPRKQKLGLYFIFALGLFVCGMSILRLHWLIIAVRSTDPTWDNIGIANWSCIELNTAIICPCLTTLKPLLSRCFPRVFSSNSSRSRHRYIEGIESGSNNAGSQTNPEALKGKRGNGKNPESDVETDERSLVGFSLGGLKPAIVHPRKHFEDA